MKPIYKRIVLKLSGEALSGGKGHGLDDDTINNICSAIKEIKKQELKLLLLLVVETFGEEKLVL